jgi:hypothetical protein
MVLNQFCSISAFILTTPKGKLGCSTCFTSGSIRGPKLKIILLSVSALREAITADLIRVLWHLYCVSSGRSDPGEMEKLCALDQFINALPRVISKAQGRDLFPMGSPGNILT